MIKGAVLSDCGRYRYLLERHWDGAGEAVGFLMLNPSTADAFEDDPTIRRCIGFAKSWGYKSLYVANLFAYRATDPSELTALTVETAAGPDRDWFLQRMGMQCRVVVAGWGASLPKYADRGFLVRTCDQTTDSLGAPEVHCLGTTRSGQPRHPLYLKGDVLPAPYRWRP